MGDTDVNQPAEPDVSLLEMYPELQRVENLRARVGAAIRRNASKIMLVLAAVAALRVVLVPLIGLLPFVRGYDGSDARQELAAWAFFAVSFALVAGVGNLVCAKTKAPWWVALIFFVVATGLLLTETGVGLVTTAFIRLPFWALALWGLVSNLVTQAILLGLALPMVLALSRAMEARANAAKARRTPN